VTWRSLPGEPTDKDFLEISLVILFAAFARRHEISLLLIRTELLGPVEKSDARAH
jgi:hypothetical protein